MAKLGQLKKFVFNGVLTENELEKLEDLGISTNAGQKRTVVIPVENGSFSPRIVFEGTKMATMYVSFFSLENSVRELIQQRLLEKAGIDWWDKCVPEKIRSNAMKVKDREEKNKYHTPRGQSLIDYTMFGDLAQIIIAQWEHFADLFPDQHWISARFNDLELSRNVIMHTGVLPQIEIDRIESISRDWMRQVG